jgi:hypothetical protein
MDCQQAREIVSEAFDRGVGETPGVAEAREHCRTCADCRAFVEGLAMLRKTPAPSAPPQLVDAIVARAQKAVDLGVPRPVVPRPLEAQVAADGGEVAAPAEDGGPDEATTAEQPEVVPAQPWEPRVAAKRPEQRDAAWWIPRLVAAAAAVIVGVFALSLSLQGFRALRPSGAAGPAESASANMPAAAPTDPNAYRATVGADSASASATKGAQLNASLGGARYVAFNGAAYVWLGDRTPDTAALTSGGQLDSSLDSSQGPTTRQVWQAKSDPDIIFIQPDPGTGTYTAFRRVLRSRGGKAYMLSVGSDITSYGRWPALPSQFSTPTADDGSPTFVAAGKDDTGLDVYVPPGASADAGFAIAPTMSSSDPAGANPNWTWWVPKP